MWPINLFFKKVKGIIGQAACCVRVERYHPCPYCRDASMWRHNHAGCQLQIACGCRAVIERPGDVFWGVEVTKARIQTHERFTYAYDFEFLHSAISLPGKFGSLKFCFAICKSLWLVKRKMDPKFPMFCENNSSACTTKFFLLPKPAATLTLAQKRYLE